MKSSISTTTIFSLIIVFTLIFSTFLALTITYNKVYKLKNETILILEKYEGIDNSISIINNYLASSGYRTKGYCDDDEYGISDLSSGTYSNDTSKKYYYCLKSIVDKKNSSVTSSSYTIKYELKLFYKFNLPFIGDIFTFDINGETKDIKYYSVDQELK